MYVDGEFSDSKDGIQEAGSVHVVVSGVLRSHFINR